MHDNDKIPGVVQISLTSRCQCRCRHCGVSLIRKKISEELSLEDLKTIFADLQQAGTKVVDFFGGEPTLRKDMFEIITLGQSCGFYLLLETNGFCLDEPYVLKLKSAGIDQVYISLDDYNEEFHDTNRNLKGVFKRAVRAINLCRENNVPVDVSFVPKDEKYFVDGHANKFFSFVFKNGADKVRILLPRFTGSMQLTSDSPFSDGKEQELIKYIDTKYLNRIYFHSPDTPLTDITICSAKQYFCHIMADGNVLPCPYLPLIFGNIKKESISNIFARIQNSEIMRIGGTHCLARDIDFVKKYLDKITPDMPYLRINEYGEPISYSC